MYSRTAPPRPYPTRASIALIIAMLVLAVLPSVAWAAPPNTTITAGPRGTVLTGTRSNTATFRFRSSKPNSRFQCRLNSGGWVACASPKTYRGLKWGRHTFRVRAIDAQRAVDASPAYRTWRFAPTAGTVLYNKTSWGGRDGWFGSPTWKAVGGMLVSDGTEYGEITAPYRPGREGVNNYAAIAQVQYVRGGRGFGLFARQTSQGTYYAGASYDYSYGWGVNLSACDSDFYCEVLTTVEFDPQGDWHTYRFEVRGNILELYVDDELALETTDNRYLSGGYIGLWSEETQVNVRSFKVVAR